MRGRALEANHTLSLFVTIGHVVRVVTYVFFSRICKSLVAWSFIGHALGTLIKENLLFLLYWIMSFTALFNS